LAVCANKCCVSGEQDAGTSAAAANAANAAAGSDATDRKPPTETSAAGKRLLLRIDANNK